MTSGVAARRRMHARTTDRAAAGTPAEMRDGAGRLGIVLASESEVIGGAEMMLLHLAHSLQGRGHRVHFVSPRHASGWLGERLREIDVPTHAVDLRRALDPGAVRDLARLITGVGADVVHSHMFTMAVYGTAATRLAGVPHVATMHGTGRETSALRRRLALRWAFRKSEAAIAVSRGLQDELRDCLGAAAADRARIVYNGVPDVAGDGIRIRRELQVGVDEPLVVAVGNLYHNKAHLALLQALATLPADLAWRVAIAGREEDATSTLRGFIAERGWERRAHLLGARQDVADVLAAADVYAMPSLREALPMSLLEGMMSGTPAIASRVGGIPEVVTDGIDGLLVPPGDVPALASALQRLLTDPALRARIGHAGRARALADFSVQTMTDAHEAVYLDILPRGSRHQPPARSSE